VGSGLLGRQEILDWPVQECLVRYRYGTVSCWNLQTSVSKSSSHMCVVHINVFCAHSVPMHLNFLAHTQHALQNKLNSFFQSQRHISYLEGIFIVKTRRQNSHTWVGTFVLQHPCIYLGLSTFMKHFCYYKLTAWIS
jgi:hypothetical protein